MIRAITVLSGNSIMADIEESESSSYSSALRSNSQFLCHFKLASFDQYGEEDKVECDVYDKTCFLGTKWRIDLYPRSQNENGVDYACLVIDAVNSLDQRDFEGMKASYRVEIINQLKKEDSIVTDPSTVDDVAYFDGYYEGVFHDRLIESSILFDKDRGFFHDGFVAMKVHIEVYNNQLVQDDDSPPLKRRRSLADDVRDLQLDKSTADVTIIVEDDITPCPAADQSSSGQLASDRNDQVERKFLVHKFILSARSDIFRSMFANNMRESIESVIKVSQFSAPVVKALIEFCYTDNCDKELIKGHVNELLEAAFYYQMSALVDFCEEKLCGLLSVENCIQMLSIANERELLELKARAIDCISKNAATLQAGVKQALTDSSATSASCSG